MSYVKRRLGLLCELLSTPSVLKLKEYISMEEELLTTIVRWELPLPPKETIFPLPPKETIFPLPPKDMKENPPRRGTKRKFYQR